MRIAVLTSLLFGLSGNALSDGSDDIVGRSELARSFEERAGPSAHELQFLHRGPGYTVRVSTEGLVVEFQDSSPLRMRFDRSRPDVALEGLAPIAGKAHWTDPTDPASNRTNIRLFDGVRVRGFQSGADLEIVATESGIGLTVVLAPEADPAAVSWALDGADTSTGGSAVLRSDAQHAALELNVTPAGAHRPEVAPVRLAVDESGHRYISGRGREADGSASAFVAKLGADDASLVWVSRFRVGESDRIAALSVLPGARVAVHGRSDSEDWIAIVSSDGSEVVSTPIAAEREEVSAPDPGASPWGPGATIDATISEPDGTTIVAGTTSSRVLDRATIVGPTEWGDSAFLARAADHPTGPNAAGCPGTINFDNSAGTGAWTTPTNWDLDRLPNATDDVCIGPGFTVTLASGTQSVASLTTDATASLTVSGGSLVLGSASTVGGPITLSGGALDGAGELTLSGVLAWTSGAMNGGGVTNANGGISFSGSSVKDLSARTLKSAGSTTWTGVGGIRLGNGASIVNSGTWTAQSDAQMTALTGGGTFTNVGTLRKSAGAGTTTIAVDLDSPGAIEIQSGTLSVNGNGTASSTITGSAGTTLRFNGNGVVYTLAAASSLGVPTVVFDAGTVNVDGTYAATTGTTMSGAVTNFTSTSNLTSIGSTLTIAGGTANFASGETIAPSTMTFSSGTLTGTDTVTVSGLLTWSGGAMTGGAITNANGGISISSSSVKDLSPRVLRSSGTTTWTGAGQIRLGGGASIENSGTWIAQSDASLAVLGGGGTFTNSGTFRKTTGTGTTAIAIVFDSPGGIEIQSGTLSINGDGTASSTIAGSAGATLRFNGVNATYLLAATSAVSVPTVVFDAGTIGVDGSYAATTGTTISGAIANFDPIATVTSIGTLTISGGSANFDSGESIAPTTMVFSAGTLTGSDNVTISGLFTWTGGLMTGGALTKADGGISFSGSAVKDLNPRVLKTAGTTTWSGAGSIRLGGGASIENSGTWDAASDASLLVFVNGGTFKNSGTFRKSAGAGTTTIAVDFDSPGGIEIQSGTINATGTTTISGTVTGSPGTTLRFSGIGINTTFGTTSNVAVSSIAFDAGTVEINGAFAATSGTTIGGAVANFNPASTVTSIGSTLTIAAGMANFISGETIAPSTMTISNGTLTGTDTVTIAGPLTWTGGVMTGGGITNAIGGIAFGSSSVKDLIARALHTAGNTTWAGDGTIRLGGAASIENSGIWDTQNDAHFDVLSGGGTFANSGTFRKSAGAGTTLVAIPFSNSGAVESSAQVIAFTGGFTQTAGSTTLNGGTITSSTPMAIQGGSLRGTGTIGATVTSSGTTSPGLSPASLSVTGDWTQSSSGHLAVELGGLVAGTQYDRLDVTAAATVAGTLDATLIGGFVPLAGDTFTILTGASRTGTFATTNLPALPPLLVWNVNYKPTSIDLKAVPLPSGRVPGDLSGEAPLQLAKTGSDLTLMWSQGCLVTDADSEIYEGLVGNFTSHVPVLCTTGGATSRTLTPGAGSRYYLIVPTNGAGEGSYGLTGAGAQRVVSTSACHFQSIATCP